MGHQGWQWWLGILVFALGLLGLGSLAEGCLLPEAASVGAEAGAEQLFGQVAGAVLSPLSLVGIALFWFGAGSGAPERQNHALVWRRRLRAIALGACCSVALLLVWAGAYLLSVFFLR